MELNPIRANMTELTVGSSLVILFSYRTPVAAYDWSKGPGNAKYFRTSRNWSRTTTRHINQWLHGMIAEEKPQEFFDELVKEVK